MPTDTPKRVGGSMLLTTKKYNPKLQRKRTIDREKARGKLDCSWNDEDTIVKAVIACDEQTLVGKMKVPKRVAKEKLLAGRKESTEWSGKYVLRQQLKKDYDSTKPGKRELATMVDLRRYGGGATKQYLRKNQTIHSNNIYNWLNIRESSRWYSLTVAVRSAHNMGASFTSLGCRWSRDEWKTLTNMEFSRNYGHHFQRRVKALHTARWQVLSSGNHN